MDATDRPKTFRALGLVGLVYFLVGVAFSTLAGAAASNGTRVAWRLAAWVTSAVAFAAHIWFERFRVRNPPSVTALHASMAAALGAFALAAAANVRALFAAAEPRHAPVIALLAWPVVIGAPAFVVAFAAASLLGPPSPSEGP